MVALPAGRVSLRDDAEGLLVPVAQFALSKHEVKRGEFQRFVEATAHSMGDSCRTWDRFDGRWDERRGLGWRDPGFEQTDAHPVVCVNWHDAKAYAAWLSSETGARYRLPHSAEWVYAVRVVETETAYSRGNEMESNRANCNGCGSAWDGEGTAPVGAFQPNAFGLHDMHGNAYEWVESRFCMRDDCGRRVLYGGGWASKPRGLRSEIVGHLPPSKRESDNGFRVARVLAP